MKIIKIVLIAIFISALVNAEECKVEPNVDVYFALKDDCSKELADRIDKAKKSVYFCTYSLTDPYIVQSIARAKKRGLEVMGVTEKQNATGKGAKYKDLLAAGVEIYLDDNPSLMHHKVAIIDGYIVATGSFNWTKNANERNNENLIFLKGKEISELYYKEFKRVFMKAKYGK